MNKKQLKEDLYRIYLEYSTTENAIPEAVRLMRLQHQMNKLKKRYQVLHSHN